MIRFQFILMISIGWIQHQEVHILHRGTCGWNRSTGRRLWTHLCRCQEFWRWWSSQLWEVWIWGRNIRFRWVRWIRWRWSSSTSILMGWWSCTFAWCWSRQSKSVAKSWIVPQTRVFCFSCSPSWKMWTEQSLFRFLKGWKLAAKWPQFRPSKKQDFCRNHKGRTHSSTDQWSSGWTSPSLKVWTEILNTVLLQFCLSPFPNLKSDSNCQSTPWGR